MSQLLNQQEETPYTNNLFSNHFLQERLSELEEWKQAEVEEAYEELQKQWEKTRDYLQTQPNEDNTKEKFLNPVLTKILGHYPDLEAQKTVSGKNLNPDYLFFKDFEHNLDAEENDKDKFKQSYALGEAKKWDRTLDKSESNHTNPAFQAYNYVDRLRTPWGILTNGRKWRLYSYEDCEADTYYEIDIVKHILKEDDREKALQNFKYFYLFFRQESFLPKENSFLDKVFQGSVNYAKGLEEDLEDDIYTALEVTARGFFEANNLEKTEENVEKVHRASLIFLYRTLFILNAESRGLLPVNEKKYKRILSLEHLKEALKDDDSDAFGEGGWVWKRRIKPLFEAINSGEQYGDFKITAYNGGLFDPEQHEFLDNHELHGKHIEKILKLLAESEDEETGEKVLVDYRDLNIRHLGSVYEGLLEHKFKVAEQPLILEKGEWKSAEDSKKNFEEVEDEKKVEEGQIYLTNESGERKATGSYYTPEYIVKYIVENTVGPKVDEKIKESSKEEVLDKVLEIDVCDPAMGSGHFLTETTSFIAHKILEHGKIEQEIEDENELVWIKRQVVSECIYGVDINPLAVELGKLSLWIETMAEGKPLSFLDHHLKVGNSLVGSDFDEILQHPFSEEQKTLDHDRFRFGSPEDAKETLQRKYQEIEQMPEETVEQVHKKEAKYEDFVKENTLYKQFRQVANIHTYQLFDGEMEGADYENFLIHNLGVEDFGGYNTEVWFKNAQQDFEDRRYFHWELEFPQVFFGEKEGFDAIVGNPPYGQMVTLGYREYLNKVYDITGGKNDSYKFFIEQSGSSLTDTGKLGFILPNTFLTNHYDTEIRSYLTTKLSLSHVMDLSHIDVFEGVTINTLVLVATPFSDNNKLEVCRYNQEKGKTTRINTINLPSDHLTEAKFEIFHEESDRELLDKLESFERKLEEVMKFRNGMVTGNDGEFVSDRKENEKYRKMLFERDTGRYYLSWSGDWIRYDPEEMKSKSNAARPREKWIFETDEKILVQWLTYGMKRRINAVVDTEKHYVQNNLIILIPREDNNLGIYTLLAIINSKLTEWFYRQKSTDRAVKQSYLKQVPLPEESQLEEGESSNGSMYSDYLSKLALNISNYEKERRRINADIRDYVVISEFGGKNLNELYTPSSGVSDTPLADTSADKENLQVGGVKIEKDGDRTTLLASARYKPENESGHDTDQYGYVESEFYPAMEFHNLSETENALIEEFVPVAVEKAGGFAKFRKKATKTMSLIDRLKKLTLPKVSDVEDDLKKFIEEKKNAEKLEEKIKKADEEINRIVYNLYDLTDEEIEIVEEAVS